MYFLSLHSIAPYISRYAVHLGASEREVAMLGPALSFVAISLRPLSGSLIDRGLLRPLLVTGVGLAVAAQAFYYISTDIALLYAGRGLQGVGVALFIPASIYTATLTGRNVASSLAWRSTMIGLSMALGPAIGGLVVSLYGYKHLFIVSLTYLLVSGLLTIVALRRLEVPKRSGGGRLEDLLNADFLVASLAILAYSIMYNSFLLFLPAYHSLLNIDVAVTTMLFTTISVANFASRVVLSVTSGKVRHPATAALGFGLALVGVALVILDSRSSYLMLYAVVAGIGGGLLIPSLQVVALLGMRERSRGLGSGIYTAMFDVGNIIGPPTAIALGGTYLDSLKVSLGISAIGLMALVVYNALHLAHKSGPTEKIR